MLKILRALWPWGSEVDEARKSMAEAVEHRERAERIDAQVDLITSRVNLRRERNGFGDDLEIRRIYSGRHA